MIKQHRYAHISYVGVLVATLATAFACAPEPSHSQNRLNDVQFLGTHNSFRQSHAPSERVIFELHNSERRAQRLQYAHPTLTQQLDLGVRKFELDLWNDPNGDRFSNPILGQLASEAGLAADYEQVDAALLSGPGIKVLHTKDDDYRSSCPTLRTCLQEVASWSDAHPEHLPIFISMQFKRGGRGDDYISRHADYLPPAPWTREAVFSVEALGLEVFGRNRLLTPDDMRGEFASPRAAARADAWPMLEDSRGKVILLVHESGDGDPIDPVTAMYLSGAPALQNRLMFVLALDPSREDAAFVNVKGDSPFQARIESLVSQGYIVRRRSDLDALNALACDFSMRDEALASGAQLVSTDYVTRDADLACPYFVQIPSEGVARCAPGRERCAGAEFGAAPSIGE